LDVSCWTKWIVAEPHDKLWFESDAEIKKDQVGGTALDGEEINRLFWWEKLKKRTHI
jgi:hypothetical protein